MTTDAALWWIRKLSLAASLLFGVSLITFYLLVYYGHDISHSLMGRHETAADFVQVHRSLGMHLDFWERYFLYLTDTLTLNFARSQITHEPVLEMLVRAIPTTLYCLVPGMVMGHSLALGLGLLSAAFNRGIFAKVSTFLTSMIMSTSLLIITLIFQFVFCSTQGLDLFPVQGWSVETLGQYLFYGFIPNSVICCVVIGFNTRFYRSIFLETLQEDQILVAKAFGLSRWKIFCNYIVRCSLIPITTRMIYAIPFEIIGGSLVIENFFNIPGMGALAHDAMASSDMPVVRAVVTLSSMGYALIFIFIDLFYEGLDPRLTIRQIE